MINLRTSLYTRTQRCIYKLTKNKTPIFWSKGRQSHLSERLPPFLSLECPRSPRSLRSFLGGGSTFSCFTAGAVVKGAVTASLGEPSRFGDLPAEDFSLEDASPLASFLSSLALLVSSFLSHLLE